MELGMSLSCSQNLELSQAQRLELAQGHQLALRLTLISALRDETYQPEATCPRCYHELLPIEIIHGFRADPNDFTTCCPRCQERFLANLNWSNAYAREELRFYCAMQTQAMLSGKEALSPEIFKREHQAIYHSAIAHYGLLKNAFAVIGITYPFDEIADAKSKIEPFLGKLFDTTIANLSGIDVKVVRQMRKSAKIPGCRTEGNPSDYEDGEA